MLNRSFFITAILFAAALPLWAQDQTPPDVQNSKNRFVGVVNANAVYVRSGPGENYYPTQKLDKGTNVTVVGIKFDWLKIAPPDGSFCYVAKVWVEKRGDGSVGRVTKANLNAWAGSALNQVKTTVQAKLNEGDDVTILGEQDEYFKIKPPTDAYLYVNKLYVDPVRPLDGVANAATTRPTDTTPAVTTSTPTGKPAAETADPANSAASTVPPTTQSAEAEAEAEKFDKLEAQFKETSAKSLEEQPVPELLAQYDAMARSAHLPESMRRIADFRLATLKTRNEARTQLLEVRKVQDEMKQKAQALKAEQEELQTRLNSLTVFTAVGTLQTSSLQQGTQTLYRLTDPATGRTMVYVRSADPKFTDFLNQFVGLRGEISTDTQLNLKVIAPLTIQAVDPAKVNQGITAQIMPPSILAAGAKTPTTNP